MKTKFAAFGVMTTLLTGLVMWKGVVEPKDTRLRFYEILTETQTHKYSNVGKTAFTSSWLDELNRMNLKHFRPCEKIQYHNIKAKLERYEEAKDPFLSSLQAVSRLYSPDRLTLEDILQIGEAEFDKAMSELHSFKMEYRESGGTYSLDQLALQPENFRTNSNEIINIYKVQIAKGEQDLASRFYDYNIPKGTAKAVSKAHKYSTYASYNDRSGSLVAYLDTASHDVSIAAFISVHEIFPGHHLYEKSRSSSGYICPNSNPKKNDWLLEGWATYAEFIAEEEGFFSDPETKLAWLDYKLTRAMRIILDVERMKDGVDYNHLKNIWTQRMPARLTSRFDPELNRLLKSNHQHLSYVLGYNEIIRTKAKLMEAFGADFDEKVFHDVMLRLQHQSPNVLYETTKIAMESPEARAGVDSVSGQQQN